MPFQDSDADSDVVSMPSARWEPGGRKLPYSEPGSLVLKLRDATKQASREIAKLTKPSESTHHFPKGEVRDSVFWTNIDGSVSKGTLCVRKLGPEEPTQSGTVIEDPSPRDVYDAAVLLNKNGIGITRFDPTTTFVTDQGRFEVSMISEDLQPSLLEPHSVAALHTGTTYMVRYEAGSMQCVRTRYFRPPVSSIILLLWTTT